MLEPGHQIGKYRILEMLDSSVAPKTCLVEDTSSGKNVALKVFALEQDVEAGLKRFKKEAKKLASLKHPGIASLYEAGIEKGFCYYTTDLLTGGDLPERIAKGLEPLMAMRILRAVADALAYIHAKGIVHRNVSSANILFREDDTAVLTNFDITKPLEIKVNLTADPRYVSPEQAKGDPTDSRSDIYSLGVVLYEMLLGKVPFAADKPFRLAMLHIHSPVPQLPENLTEYQPLLDRMLAKNPADRFANGGELVEAVDAQWKEALDSMPERRPESLEEGAIAAVGEEKAADEDVQVKEKVAVLLQDALAAKERSLGQEIEQIPEKAPVDALAEKKDDASKGRTLKETGAGEERAWLSSSIRSTLFKGVAAGLFLGIVAGFIFHSLFQPAPERPLEGEVGSIDPLAAARFRDGVELSEAGKTEKAIKVFRDIIETNPGRPESYNNLAALYAKQGDLEKAKQILEAGLEAHGGYATVYQNLGKIYAEMARDSYGKALRLKARPTSPELQFLADLSDGREPILLSSARAEKPIDVAAKAPKTEEKAPPPTVAALSEPAVSEEPVAIAERGSFSPASEVSSGVSVEEPDWKAHQEKIVNSLNAWAQAWSQQDVPLYLSFYSKDYRPSGGISREQWEKQRQVRLKQPGWIDVSIRDFQIESTGADTVRVKLIQSYRADNYSDTVRKSINLKREGDSWLIFMERSLGAVR